VWQRRALVVITRVFGERHRKAIELKRLVATIEAEVKVTSA
jgi:hypothetical protein